MSLTVLFGSVEYFLKEFQNAAAQYHLNELTNAQVSLIYSALENELLNDFVCEESIRLQCIANLSAAYQSLYQEELYAASK